MSKFFVENDQIQGNNVYILGEDVKHISKVLRLQVNNNIIVCNSENGENFNCKIINIKDDKIECFIQKKEEINTESLIDIDIFQALPKADKMELIIQKATELGAKKINPINMERCIVKLKEKDAIKKIERWQKIAEVAAKQSGRNIIPTVSQLKSLNQVKDEVKDYDLFLVAYENEKENTLKKELKKLYDNKCLGEFNKYKIKIGVLIGPEGGIAEKEIEILKSSGAKIITLGNRILRTETVALALTSIIMYELS